MKILSFASYIKAQVEEVGCPKCEKSLIFNRVNYDHRALKNGGCVQSFAMCTGCREEVEVVIEIDPVEKDLIEGSTGENIYKTIFFTNKKRKRPL